MVVAGCAATGDFVLATVLLLGMTLAPAHGWWSDVKNGILRDVNRACFKHLILHHVDLWRVVDCCA